MESDNSAPDDWEQEAEEVTTEELEAWKKEKKYVFKTERDEEYVLPNYTSIIDQSAQLSQYYKNQKATLPVEPSVKKEFIPKAKQEEVVERLDKKKLISELTGSPYSENIVKKCVNVVFIGHVDAGKSTLCGGLMLKCQRIEPRVVEQYELEARENNRQSWWLAYIMDENEDEREKGITIEVGRAFLETPHRLICILDAPGHKSFVPNMISAAAQADIAAVVVSARPGEFESGFQKGGQTMEHILLSKSMGVESFIVVITKMDTVNWDIERFEFIRAALLPFLTNQCKIPQETIFWLPISGLEGKNLNSPGGCSWYTGPDFLALLDSVEIQQRAVEAPLRLPIYDKTRDIGTVLIGKIEAGLIVKGMKVAIMPGNLQTEVSEILGIEDIRITFAEPGMNVKLRVKGCEEVRAGSVVCDIYDFPNVTEEFLAEIQVLDLISHKPLLLPGYTCVIHVGVSVNDCSFSEIIAKIDEATGKKIKAGFCKGNCRIIAKIKLKDSMCLEKFKDFKPLGRFTIRDEDITIGLGKILSIL